MKRKKENGFEEWVSGTEVRFAWYERAFEGGYMNAKISKLEAQFNEDKAAVSNQNGTKSDIFKGISIFVNGYTEPSSDELRCLMLLHGGTYHHYFRTEKTTHIIASTLPNTKFDQMKTFKVVKPNWITDSIAAGKLLNYTKYLLQNDFPQLGSAGKSDWSSKLCTNKETCSTGLKISKTAADEGYLKEFYSNSRLHYISTLGNMLKQHVCEMREKHTGDFPQRKVLMDTSHNQPSPEESCLGESIVMHVDMDCFFVSVALRKHPHLKGQPVAVTHARSNMGSKQQNTDRNFEVKFYKNKMKSKIRPKTDDYNDDDDDDDSFNSENEQVEKWSAEVSSMSEIASCSYEARKAGVSKGMYLGAALKLCPNLKTVPYDFEGYKDVSMELYNIIAQYTLDIEAVSCDELFVDCTNLLLELRMAPTQLAEILRSEIENKTNCTASIGIGGNKLQARLATKHAKPNGQFYLSPDKLNDFMGCLSVHEIPGVGRTIGAQLHNLSVKTCGDLQSLSLAFLKKEFGNKTGDALYNHCRGIDNKGVNFSRERKSVSAEVNYGIRFNDNEEAELFLKQLSQEVSNRLRNVKLMGKNITLKVMFRAKDAPVETAKYLGHGACDSVSRSASLPSSTSDAVVISKQIINLYHQINVPPNDLRGIGIQVTKLENENKVLKTLHTYFDKNNQKNKINPDSSANDAKQCPNERLSVSIPPGTNTSSTSIDESEKPAPSDTTQLNIDEEMERLLVLKFHEIKGMIKAWVTAEQDPEPFDVIVLKAYFKRLIEKKNLEKLCILIRCLHRCIISERKDHVLWQVTYDDIIDSVQSCMVTVFGRTLADEAI